MRSLDLFSQWYHVASDREYEILALGKLEKDMTPMVVYSNVHDHSTWIRPVSEFLDGRFVKL